MIRLACTRCGSSRRGSALHWRTLLTLLITLAISDAAPARQLHFINTQTNKPKFVGHLSATNLSTLTLLKGSRAKVLLQQIDRTQLPAGAVTDFINQREFLLRAPGTQDLGIVAIYFHYEPSGQKPQPPEQCGVFLVPSTGNSKYIPVIGPDTQLGSSLCGGVLAVGTNDDPGPRPRLIVIFNATNMHGTDYPSPWVLSWDRATDSYAVNGKDSTWLWNQKTPVSILAIRELLKHHG